MTVHTVTIAGRSYPVRGVIYEGRLLDLRTAVELASRQRPEPEPASRWNSAVRRILTGALTAGFLSF